uniref:Uncharacterized protein n=1 Tax=viral metagenome TaxID=1070528 RepID=A0A6C0J013_9ZZZZ
MNTINNINNDIDVLINNCITYESHMEIALVIYTLLKDKYRYIGDNKWEYYNDNEWKKDKNNINLINDIKATVCNIFITKSIEWNNKYIIEEDSNIKYIYKRRYDSLIDIIVNLKNKKYINNIIKECKQFFTI